MRSISRTLENIGIGAPITYRNLHVFPVFGEPTRADDYVTLDAGVSSGAVKLTEVTDAGQVPVVKLASECDKPVFLLDGQELIGAMQDRVLNTSVLAPARGTVIVPVSCVEAARWDPETPEFAPAGHVHFAAARAQRVAQVTQSLVEDGEASSDQVDIWAAIDERARNLRIASPTRAHAALFSGAKTRLDKFVGAVRPLSGQTGAIFAVGREIAGIDIFDCAETLAACLPMLVRSAALDALVSPTGGPPSACDVTRFVGRVRSARTLRFAGVGVGEDVRLCGPALAGGALVWGGRVVHLCAFDLTDEV